MLNFQHFIVLFFKHFSLNFAEVFKFTFNVTLEYFHYMIRI